MIAERAWREPSVWGGPAVLTAISGLLLLAPSSWQTALRYSRIAIGDGQLWRLWSDNFVHLGFWHWFFNALSLVLWIAVCPRRLNALDWGLRVLVIGGGVSVGLYLFTPNLQTYVGLSGFIYGLFLLDLGVLALRGDRIALAGLIFLVLRVGWEVHAGAPAYEVRLIGGPVAATSHVWGMVTALLYGLLAGSWGRWIRNQKETNAA
jgi:Rhomboid family.